MLCELGSSLAETGSKSNPENVEVLFFCHKTIVQLDGGLLHNGERTFWYLVFSQVKRKGPTPTSFDS